MKVTIQCFAQLARAAGASDHVRELAEGATAQDALREFAESTTAEARALLFTEAGELQPTILLFLDDEPILWSEPRAASDDSSLFVATPIAGG
jgi:hypothetical protein